MATPRLAAPGPGAPAGIPPVVPPAGGGGVHGPAMWPDDVRPRNHHRVRTYLTWVAIVLGILAGPTALAAICNRFGWTGAISYIMAAVGLGFAIALPLLVGATGVVDLFRKLKKPKEGATEAEKDAWCATHWAFDRWCILFFGSLMGPSALMILPLEGYGKLAALAVALAIPTIAYAIRYSEKIWVIEYFAKLLVIAFCTVLAYWLISATMPNVVQSVKDLANNQVIGPIMHILKKAGMTSGPDQLVREIEEEVAKSNTNKVTTCLNKLKLQAAAGVNITPAQTEACHSLNKSEWKAASGAQSSATASTATGAASQTAAATPQCETRWGGTYIPGTHLKAMAIEGLCDGTYQVKAPGERQQAFFVVPADQDQGASRYTRTMDACGKYQGKVVWQGSQTTNAGGGHGIPDANKPYGSFVFRSSGVEQFPCETGGRIVVKNGRLEVDINTFRHPDVYGGAVGNQPAITDGIRLTLEKV